MKIRLNSIFAGPQGTFQPGAVIEAAPELGAALIAGGYGVEIATTAQQSPPRPPAPIAENMASAQPETADQKTARSGRRAK